ncbi:phospholipase A and acyltransferase 3-like [Ruditapes philippinarum]|uniref:phospholipase A and acyltransferase 3-like n=1 Tax=Ruditapes philippinarum TaxID=129788 RepID=UPI00295B318E|nr:phospholipase A and acyltransferase 3-like [Ruditapes philippinarum]XP_060580381.1 phospholipase A and acyltransferase 3-like [Ruditapes philippinarum]
MAFLFGTEISISDLEEGDLIEFYRSIYCHWAVYIGNGNVIHLLSNPNDITGKSNNKDNKGGGGNVQIDDIRSVAGDSKTYRHNDLDKQMTPFSKTEIVRRARMKVGKHKYGLITYNCEHFATECRYGEARSLQVEKYLYRFGKPVYREIQQKGLSGILTLPAIPAKQIYYTMFDNSCNRALVKLN